MHHIRTADGWRKGDWWVDFCFTLNVIPVEMELL